MIKDLVTKLYPLNRQINGADTDKALEIIGEHIPNYEVHRFASGTECWTWTVPKRWKLLRAQLWCDDGCEEYHDGWRLILYRQGWDHDARVAMGHNLRIGSPLSVVAYSQPIDATLSWDELEPHLHYSEKRPDAIPWVYNHYKEDWGFCLPKTTYDKLPRDALYYVVIESVFTDEPMSVGTGTLNIPWDSPTEGRTAKTSILLCAHVCHPTQANDDLSGVAVLCEVAKRLAENPLPDDSLGVRLLFCPETIGSTAYLSRNEHLIPHIKAGVFVEMAGTDNDLQLKWSWQEKTVIDNIAASVVANNGHTFKRSLAYGVEFTQAPANDEKVINGPGVDIPCISLSRWPYNEYHTSDDTPDIISQDKLKEMADIVERIVRIYCTDYKPKRTFTGYLNTRRYGVWVDWKEDWNLHVATQKILHMLEGDLSVFEISQHVDLDYWHVRDYIEGLRKQGLVCVQ